MFGGNDSARWDSCREVSNKGVSVGDSESRPSTDDIGISGPLSVSMPGTI